MADAIVGSMEKPGDLGKSPAAIARRWKLELKLADKRESDWRKKAADIYKQYTPPNPAANSFNILWTNTETLRQSVYNSLPEPQVRRRYQDEDPLGKAVSEVMTRALEFSQDTYDEDAVLKGDVLAMLLAGRAVSRVRYIPDFRQIGVKDESEDQEAQDAEAYEEIAWEQTICARVQWDDFRILGAVKTWDEVCAIAFRHKFTRDDCIEKFGEEVGNKITLNNVDDEDVNKASDTGDLFKTAEVWEIWNKDDKEVIWICTSYAEPCKVQPDPLNLSGFFPVPRPLYAIENDQTLIPAALFTQYEQQAKELNRISIRINKLVEALKVRGIYDSTLSELSQLMKAGDNELIPAQNVAAIAERSGLDKVIFMMPIEIIAAVLKYLYEQRDQTKQVIYEITGIADIMRGATDANETKGAQVIKTQWGTQRLQRMQKEVQRYIRDLLRLKAEIIAEKFQPETLEKMTLVQLPHQAELEQKKQQLMMQYQQQSAMAQQQGQQPPPPPPELQQPMPISWEAVVDAMRNDATRTYRIDIETDSTLSATQDSDMEGLQMVLTACAKILEAFGPAVQQGAMSIDVVKEMMLTVCRRAKMGSAVEDAIGKIKQPPPPQDPEAGKAQAQMQIEQMKAQIAEKQAQQELAAEQQRAQLEAQVEQAKQESQAQQNAHQNMLEQQRAESQMQMEAALEQQRIAADQQRAVLEEGFNRWKAELDAAVKIEVANIASKAKLQDAATDTSTAEVAREVR